MLNSQIQLDFNNSFYNTVEVSGFDLSKFEKRAKSLEYFILAKIFKKGKEYSPYDVLDACKALNYPTKENSVRRALHNLTGLGKCKAWVVDGKAPIELTGNKDNSETPNNTYKLK